MRQDNLEVSIILVNWNALELTSAALTSIREQVRGISYEVLVVDNNSTMDASSVELPRRFPWVEFIANRQNVGFSKANNQAIRRSRGRYVLLLNNDTIQISNAIGETLHYMDAHQEVGAMGVLHLNNDANRSVQESCFQFPKPWKEVASLLGMPITFSDPAARQSGERDVDWIVGSYLFARRPCLDDVGLLDERFFLYDEDIDWCLRAKRCGWKVRYWPQAAFIHIGSAVRPFMRDKTFIHYRSHLSFIRKHHSMAAAAAYYLAMSVRLALATGKQILLGATGRATRQDIADRFTRQLMFAFLRSGNSGISKNRR